MTTATTNTQVPASAGTDTARSTRRAIEGVGAHSRASSSRELAFGVSPAGSRTLRWCSAARARQSPRSKTRSDDSGNAKASASAPSRVSSGACWIGMPKRYAEPAVSHSVPSVRCTTAPDSPGSVPCERKIALIQHSSAQHTSTQHSSTQTVPAQPSPRPGVPGRGREPSDPAPRRASSRCSRSSAHARPRSRPGGHRSHAAPQRRRVRRPLPQPR